MMRQSWFILILLLIFLPEARSEETSFSKFIEIEKSLELKTNEIYDSAPIDVSSFRYAMILVEKDPPEKMPDPPDSITVPSEEEIYVGVDIFFYLDSNIPREVKKGSPYPLLVNKGFLANKEFPGGGNFGEPAPSYGSNVFKNRVLQQVEVRAPYMVVRVKPKSASHAKLRIAVFLRK